MVTHFLKGLDRIYSQVCHLIPALVLSNLMGTPFEPLAICSLLYLSWKEAFLVTVTSVRRVTEFKALTSGPLYTVFHKDL